MNKLMHHVKVILILLLKNMSHQKIYILILFDVDNKVAIPSTLLKKPSDMLNVFEK